MPELPELEVVQEVLSRRIVGQTILTAESIPPGGPIVVRDLTGEGFAAILADPSLIQTAQLRSCSAVDPPAALTGRMALPYLASPAHE